MTKRNRRFDILEWTGERYLPEIEGEIAAEHLHRYALARDLVHGKDVLDIACGEGYGANLLSDVAQSVIGMDLDVDVIHHASSRYVRPGLSFKVGSCSSIPLQNNSIDAIVSFETIEHHSQHSEMFEEFRRILRPDGFVVISSPDKHEYSDVPSFANPFHVKELYLNEFYDLLRARFRNVAMYGQRVCYGSVVAPLHASELMSWNTYSGGSESIRRVDGMESPLYFIAIASDGPLDSLPSGIFSDTNLRPTQFQLSSLNQTIEERNNQIAAYQRQAERITEQLKTDHERITTANLQISELNRRLCNYLFSGEPGLQGVSDPRREIAELRLALSDRETQLARVTAELQGVIGSRTWRYSRAIRKLKLFKSANALHQPVSADVNSGNGSRSGPETLPASVSQPANDLTGGQCDFDPDFYLKLYPDVRDNYSGTPFEHFLLHGKAEGRVGQLPKYDYWGDFSKLNPERATVLVVSHEASATGAPVVSLNIIIELKKRFNVVALVLNGGSLFDDLRASADIVACAVTRTSEIVVGYQIDDLISRCRIDFAIVNSTESRSVLPELARHFIPSIALIHEFASYTRPRHAIEDTVFWATETIFSADVVRKNALSAFPDLLKKLPPVIPQGKCVHVLTRTDDSSKQEDLDRIKKTFRPIGWPKDTPVILGIGSVHFRKGVDLFIACAARVSQAFKCRFIWIGNGFDPEHDRQYSVYLSDQIQRAGLSESFAFMKETSQLAFAYENADVLVVSSRLDPLPNVSIDAVSLGLPIVCFDRATGMADILRKNGLKKECVASYLDVENMAQCVIRFLMDPALRQETGVRLKAIAERTFDMAAYVGELERIGLEGISTATQENLDALAISESPLPIMDYLVGTRGKDFEKNKAIRHFVRSWKNGFFLRKPYPGFHPGIYRERCGILDQSGNPFAHYLRAGKPSGPWEYEVLHPSSDAKVRNNVSAVLHVHAFYPDLFPTILERLQCNRIRPDLFVTVTSELDAAKVGEISRAYTGKVDIQVVRNIGRDIGPFLNAFKERLSTAYEFVGHVHTKKTSELNDDAMGRTWFQFLMENLLGNRHPMMDTILGKMVSDPTIGMVFPDDPNVVGWSKNHEVGLKLASKIGMRSPIETQFNFPVGTMFWARTSAIKRLLDLGLDSKDYPSEPIPSDGTVLHAFERLLPFLVEDSGHRCLATHVPGVTR